MFGTATGIVTPMVCCLVGLVLFAWRGRGRTRVLGIIGTASLLFGQIFAIAWMLFGLALDLAAGIQAIQWIATVLAVVFPAGGLIFIGMAFVPKQGDVSSAQSPHSAGSFSGGRGGKSSTP